MLPLCTIRGMTNVKFPFMDSTIPAKPAYGVYISQLVCIGRIYETFVERHRIITSIKVSITPHFVSMVCHSLVVNQLSSIVLFTTQIL